MAAKNTKKAKYNEEIMKIRQLGAINKVLKKGDVENAFLNNTDKDVETIKDSAVERMLDELNLGKNEARELQMVDSLVTGSSERAARPRLKISRKPRRAAAKSTVRPKKAKTIKKKARIKAKKKARKGKR